MAVVVVPRYRARKRRSIARWLWRVIWRAVAVLVVTLVGAVVALRFVDPPTTAFMLGARFEAWRAGETLSVQNRWAAGPCLPDGARLAVIAAEDQKFASHRGFDMAQIADALAQAQDGGRLRGASTISQQTAKNLFLWPGQSWLRKGLEAALTMLLEAVWPKRRILEVYLNVAEFAPGVYGLQAAARRFFDKDAAALTAAESALLAAVLPSPRRLDVGAPSAYVRQRQRWILGQMPRVALLPEVDGLLDPEARCPAGD